MAFGVDRINICGGVVQHVLDVRGVGLIEWIHTFQLHRVTDSEVTDSFGDPAEETVVKAEPFGVGKRV